jgi:GrpB-like predicted nucleotidyltransferase (UPF0157 family)
VVLADQDRSRWDRDLMAMGFHHFDLAIAGEEVSGYHVQAAIAATHARASSGEDEDWPLILKLYDQLLAMGASPVAELNRAVAVARVHGAAAGLAEVERLASDAKLKQYYLLLAVRGHLLLELGRRAEAAECYVTALEMRCSEPERRFLRRKRAECEASVSITIADYDARWPEMFRTEAEKIRNALGDRALRVEHVGSTSVPDLPAKPVIDIVLAVEDSAAEGEYAPALKKAGYQLSIREPEWYEHRLLKGPQDGVNLHVFSAGCPEIETMLLFRDWLRSNGEDRELYARTKRELAQRPWKDIDDYAKAKSAVVSDILTRARHGARVS